MSAAKQPITEEEARLLLAQEKTRAQKDLAYLDNGKWKKKTIAIIVVVVVIMIVIAVVIGAIRGGSAP